MAEEVKAVHLSVATLTCGYQDKCVYFAVRNYDLTNSA